MCGGNRESRAHLLRLWPGLYHDAAPALDLDVQVVPIKQQHTHEGVLPVASALISLG